MVMQDRATVFVVDDDQTVLTHVCRLLRSVQYQCKCFSNAEDFLDAYSPSRPECLILDLKLPGMSGYELQKELEKRCIRIPIIIFTGHADVAAAVKVMRAGALDLVEKPFREQVLLDAINLAIHQDAQLLAMERRKADLAQKIQNLSELEKTIYNEIVEGKDLRELSDELDVSQDIIRKSYKKLLEKMGCESVIDLIRLEAKANSMNGINNQ